MATPKVAVVDDGPSHLLVRMSAEREREREGFSRRSLEFSPLKGFQTILLGFLGFLWNLFVSEPQAGIQV